MISFPASFRHLACVLVAATISSVAADSPPALERFHYEETHMSTRFQITLYAKDHSTAVAAATAAFRKAAEVEHACSDYSATSELSQLMKPPATQEISPLLADVLQKALDIAEETQAAYDPTIGGHTWNWRRAKTRGKLPTQEAIDQAKQITRWQNLTVSTASKSPQATKKIDRMKIDLGGIAKGYAADLMLNIIQKHGITSVSIAAGGDIRLGHPPPGKKGWRVGLKTLSTESTTNSQPFIIVSNCAVSTSGDLHQFIEISGTRYSHIVNPSTGLGLIQRVSATVISATATRADALATASCVSKQYAHTLINNTHGDQLLLYTLDHHQKPHEQKSAQFPTIHHK